MVNHLSNVNLVLQKKIKQFEQENKKLKEALFEISNFKDKPNCICQAADIAKEALREDK